MSILIRGLEMPQGEEMLCINVYPDGKVCIDLDLHCKRVATAVSVPPHGRLIDADDVNNHILGYVDLRDCPTIIPAEED